VEMQCSCGNFQIEWFGEKENLLARQCNCDYCRTQEAAFISDPTAPVTFHIKDKKRSRTVQHGYNSADFLECECCGVVLVSSEVDGQLYCVVNAIATGFTDFQIDSNLKDYHHEALTERLARRQKNWSPATQIF